MSNTHFFMDLCQDGLITEIKILCFYVLPLYLLDKVTKLTYKNR